jgi:hypothetical protein
LKRPSPGSDGDGGACPEVSFCLSVVAGRFWTTPALLKARLRPMLRGRGDVAVAMPAEPDLDSQK